MQVPDFQIGYGTEVEQGIGWADVTVVLIVLSPLLIAAWIWHRKRKTKEAPNLRHPPMSVF